MLSCLFGGLGISMFRIFHGQCEAGADLFSSISVSSACSHSTNM
jgi:hypothetical protein